MWCEGLVADLPLSPEDGQDAAVIAAEKAIMGRRLVRMTPHGFDAFMAAIEAPAKTRSRMGRTL
jgi:uncharacterized protein (DUF1778 family)